MRAEEKIRVFVVEDHPRVAEAVKAYLEVSGFSVDLVHDMKTALKRARNRNFDVLLCDLHLPDGTGWELLEKLKQSKPKVCALAYSVSVHYAQRERSRAAGFIDHLSKTIAPAELVAALRRAAAVAEPQWSEGRPGKTARPRRKPMLLRKSRLCLLFGYALAGASWQAFVAQ